MAWHGILHYSTVQFVAGVPGFATQDEDRFLADKEVDCHGTTSVANNPSPSPIAIADAVVSGDHARDRGCIFRAVTLFVSCWTVCVVHMFSLRR